ncbi:hypothetical protein DPMN_004208 [Dreissena polymorpha]|uniref:Uncharacterized protein n=1 Tax=Dreissena polymorpha TaxID=45954 RepID=A0A9D4MMF2_DREPO|nr:hypothetical protein DPMN_004208 [Dreissena polymorpha]
MSLRHFAGKKANNKARVFPRPFKGPLSGRLNFEIREGGCGGVGVGMGMVWVRSDFARQRLPQRIEETNNIIRMEHHGVYSQSEYLVLSLKEDQRQKISKDNK